MCNMPNKATNSVLNDGYSERQALQYLMQSMNKALIDADEKKRIEDIDSEPTFMITVGGNSIEFRLGGVEFLALDSFIKYIAAEDNYVVDRGNLTVTERVDEDDTYKRSILPTFARIK